jgi:5-enolpyruvylshikimate-3-phosphate synthase
MELNPILGLTGTISSPPVTAEILKFFIATAALNPFPEKVIIKNCNLEKHFEEKILVSLLHQLNSSIHYDSATHELEIIGGCDLKGFEMNCQKFPDLIPILTILGIFAQLETKLTHLDLLSEEKMEKIQLFVDQLKHSKIAIELTDREINIEGPQQIEGCQITQKFDLPYLLAFTIQALYARSNSKIEGFESISHSYPNFLSDAEKLGILPRN